MTKLFWASYFLVIIFAIAIDYYFGMPGMIVLLVIGLGVNIYLWGFKK